MLAKSDDLNRLAERLRRPASMISITSVMSCAASGNRPSASNARARCESENRQLHRVPRAVEPSEMKEHPSFQIAIAGLARDLQGLTVGRFGGGEVAKELMEKADEIDTRAFERSIAHAAADGQCLAERRHRAFQVAFA